MEGNVTQKKNTSKVALFIGGLFTIAVLIIIIILYIRSLKFNNSLNLISILEIVIKILQFIFTFIFLIGMDNLIKMTKLRILDIVLFFYFLLSLISLILFCFFTAYLSLKFDNVIEFYHNCVFFRNNEDIYNLKYQRTCFLINKYTNLYYNFNYFCFFNTLEERKNNFCKSSFICTYHNNDDNNADKNQMICSYKIYFSGLLNFDQNNIFYNNDSKLLNSPFYLCQTKNEIKLDFNITINCPNTYNFEKYMKLFYIYFLCNFCFSSYLLFLIFNLASFREILHKNYSYQNQNVNNNVNNSNRIYNNRLSSGTLNSENQGVENSEQPEGSQNGTRTIIVMRKNNIKRRTKKIYTNDNNSKNINNNEEIKTTKILINPINSDEFMNKFNKNNHVTELHTEENWPKVITQLNNINNINNINNEVGKNNNSNEICPDNDNIITIKIERKKE